MLLRLKKELRTRLHTWYESVHGQSPVTEPDIRVPEAKFGDLSTNAALAWAQVFRRPPRKLAEDIANMLKTWEKVERVDIAGPGFVNIHFRRGILIRDMFAHPELLKPEPFFKGKIIIEHTNINPNKAAHVGHLRNAVLGDTLVRLWRYAGADVEVHNYIDDTGVQVADVVIGFSELENKTTVEALNDIPEPFDYYCWDLYTRVQEWFEENPKRLEFRRKALHALETGEGLYAELGREIVRRIMKAHLRTMHRLGIEYDLLPKESDILAQKFWQHAFTLLKEKGAIQYVEEGKNAGCWVMPLKGHPKWENLADADKVLVRSDGTVTYVAKDIAYQMWKFGLLPADFRYTHFPCEFYDRPLWTTTSGEGLSEHPQFGHARRVYNVIDVRQSYLQDIVAEALRRLGYEEYAENSIHFAYEMVALSRDTAERLGMKPTSEGDVIAFSGRKGIGVKADDLLHAVEALTYEEVRARSPEESEEKLRERARQIACSAVRFFLLQFSRTTVIAFDMKSATRLDGDTGPYIQYAYVRARHIFEKLGIWGREWAWLKENVHHFPGEEYWKSDEGQEVWRLFYESLHLDDAVERALRSHDLNLVALYVLERARNFHRFYLKYRMLNEKDPMKQYARVLATAFFLRTLRTGMELLGLPEVDKM